MDTFRIAAHDIKHDREVSGEIIGPLGIHLDSSGDPVVTHLRTGYGLNKSLPCLRNMEEARSVVTALAEAFDWDFGEWRNPDEHSIDGNEFWEVACNAHPNLAEATGE